MSPLGAEHHGKSEAFSAFQRSAVLLGAWFEVLPELLGEDPAPPHTRRMWGEKKSFIQYLQRENAGKEHRYQVDDHYLSGFDLMELLQERLNTRGSTLKGENTSCS